MPDLGFGDSHLRTSHEPCPSGHRDRRPSPPRTRLPNSAPQITPSVWSKKREVCGWPTFPNQSYSWHLLLKKEAENGGKELLPHGASGCNQTSPTSAAASCIGVVWPKGDFGGRRQLHRSGRLSHLASLVTPSADLATWEPLHIQIRGTILTNSVRHQLTHSPFPGPTLSGFAQKWLSALLILLVGLVPA